jgi:hypothetical protein
MKIITELGQGRHRVRTFAYAFLLAACLTSTVQVYAQQDLSKQIASSTVSRVQSRVDAVEAVAAELSQLKSRRTDEMAELLKSDAGKTLGVDSESLDAIILLEDDSATLFASLTSLTTQLVKLDTAKSALREGKVPADKELATLATLERALNAVLVSARDHVRQIEVLSEVAKRNAPQPNAAALADAIHAERVRRDHLKQLALAQADQKARLQVAGERDAAQLELRVLQLQRQLFDERKLNNVQKAELLLAEQKLAQELEFEKQKSEIQLEGLRTQHRFELERTKLAVEERNIQNEKELARQRAAVADEAHKVLGEERVRFLKSQKVQQLLASFTGEAHSQPSNQKAWEMTNTAGPVSYAALLATGALEDSIRGKARLRGIFSTRWTPDFNAQPRMKRPMMFNTGDFNFDHPEWEHELWLAAGIPESERTLAEELQRVLRDYREELIALKMLAP